MEPFLTAAERDAAIEASLAQAHTALLALADLFGCEGVMMAVVPQPSDSPAHGTRLAVFGRADHWGTVPLVAPLAKAGTVTIMSNTQHFQLTGEVLTVALADEPAVKLVTYPPPT